LRTADGVLQSVVARDAQSPAAQAVLGDLESARGNRREARRAYERAMTGNQPYAAVAGLTTLDVQEGHAKEARQRIAQLRLAPPSEAAYAWIEASLALTDGDAAAAAKSLQQIGALETRHQPAMLQLAQSLIAAGHPNLAQQVLQKWEARWPLSNDAVVISGRVLEALGRPGEAQAIYEALIAKNPDAGAAAFRLANLYVEKRQNLDVALTLARTAKARFPNDPAVDELMGWVHVQLNDPDRAVIALETAVRKAPTEPLYRYHLGVAYFRAARRLVARAELAKALELSPTFAGAADARQIMATLR
jgi:tetratricopeptide (TPR) repeat protein